MGNPTIIVHFSGPMAGQVEFEGIHPDQYNPLILEEDGTIIIPDFCGLRITKPDVIQWTNNGQVVNSLPNYADFYQSMIDLDHDENSGDYHYSTYYLGGVWFTGPMGQCAGDNKAWNFPIPLTYDNPNPTSIADRLVIQTYGGTIQFLDYSVDQPKPVEDPSFGDPPDGSGVNPVFEGPASIAVATPTGPPLPLGFTTVPIERQLLGIQYFFQPAKESFQLLLELSRKYRSDEPRFSKEVMVQRQIREVSQQFDTLLGLVQAGESLLESALPKRQAFRAGYSKSSYAAYYHMLDCSRKSFLAFRQVYNSFQLWKKMVKTDRTFVRMKTIKRNMETVARLSSEATLQAQYLNNIIWPLENGEQIFRQRK